MYLLARTPKCPPCTPLDLNYYRLFVMLAPSSAVYPPHLAPRLRCRERAAKRRRSFSSLGWQSAAAAHTPHLHVSPPIPLISYF